MAIDDDELNTVGEANAGEFLQGLFAAVGALGEGNAVNLVEAAPAVGWRPANCLIRLQDGRYRHLSSSALEGPLGSR